MSNGVQALVDAIKARKVATVYAESLDRISRDSGDLHRFRKLLKHYGSDFVSISDGMTPSTPPRAAASPAPISAELVELRAIRHEFGDPQRVRGRRDQQDAGEEVDDGDAKRETARPS